MGNRTGFIKTVDSKLWGSNPIQSGVIGNQDSFSRTAAYNGWYSISCATNAIKETDKYMELEDGLFSYQTGCKQDQKPQRQMKNGLQTIEDKESQYLEGIKQVYVVQMLSQIF